MMDPILIWDTPETPTATPASSTSSLTTSPLITPLSPSLIKLNIHLHQDLWDPNIYNFILKPMYDEFVKQDWIDLYREINRLVYLENTEFRFSKIQKQIIMIRKQAFFHMKVHTVLTLFSLTNPDFNIDWAGYTVKEKINLLNSLLGKKLYAY